VGILAASGFGKGRAGWRDLFFVPTRVGLLISKHEMPVADWSIATYRLQKDFGKA
jgi:hypothetical protein